MQSVDLLPYSQTCAVFQRLELPAVDQHCAIGKTRMANGPTDIVRFSMQKIIASIKNSLEVRHQ